MPERFFRPYLENGLKKDEAKDRKETEDREVRVEFLQFREKPDDIRKCNRKRKEENNSGYISEVELTGLGE